MNKFYFILPLFVCVCFCTSAVCFAEEVDPDELFTFVCSFDKVSSIDGVKKTNDIEFPPIKFIYKANEQKALMVGNAGTVEVLVVLRADSVDFIQIEPINVTTTILFKTAEVVHSRNTVLVGTLMPSQYYGTVVVK